MNEVSLKPVIDELETLFSKFNKAFRPLGISTKTKSKLQRRTIKAAHTVRATAFM